MKKKYAFLICIVGALSMFCGCTGTQSTSARNIQSNSKRIQNPQIEKIDLDLNAVGYSLCITDTKGSHADLTPDYAAVPAEMK